MDIITTAIIAALAAVSKDAIKDSYNALKSALKEKFGAESKVVGAVKELEDNPNSEARQAVLKEEVGKAKVNDDAEIVTLANNLLDETKKQPDGEKTITMIQKNILQGINAGRDIVFNPSQKGSFCEPSLQLLQATTAKALCFVALVSQIKI
ncbi:MAG: hypothetical protein AAGE96_10395 [Cyanobacteria bacterium P01_G01_bin.19]